ncbi:MAG: hypothetical protein P9L97_03605 [Candidatus Tenebribacter davisii]|nr:hypothetical protein [Candidatus Tenebribacter davisii]
MVKKSLKVNDDFIVNLISDKFSDISDIVKSYQNLFLSFDSHFAQIRKNFEEFSINIISSLESLGSTLKYIPASLKFISKKLAYQGWFVNSAFDISDVNKIAELIVAKQFDEIDSFMSIFIENNFEEIRKLVVERNNDRKSILESAFNAHNNGEYNLSIPVFLAQSDGICHDLLGEMLFATRIPKKKEDPSQKKVPKTAKAIHKFAKSNSITRALVEPLMFVTALNLSEKEKQIDIINRHEILHGKDLNYGTKLNSLKSISLLYFVSSILYDSIEQYVNLLSKISIEHAKEIEPELDKLRDILGLKRVS